MPVIAAPTGGTTYNMGGKLTEEEFVNAICGGCNKAGTLGAVTVSETRCSFMKNVFRP